MTAKYVRESIRRYLADPITLPQFQGSLDSRVSWRLPEEDLERIGRGGDRGVMVRRVVAAALSSAGKSAIPIEEPTLAQPKDTDIVSEELIGEDFRGYVIIEQRDFRGFGYRRTVAMDRGTYLKARRP